MLQITSNTGEINTGPELVQNGSFDQLGTDQVQNGSFAEISSTDVITDGGFSATGTELVTNGDFSGVTEYVGTWSTIGSGWTLSGSNLIGSSGTTENLQTIFATAVSRTLRLSYEITNYSSGQVAMLMDGESKTFESANGIYTRIITTTSQILEIDGRDSDPFTGTITNISVKELGEDWAVEQNWFFQNNTAKVTPNNTTSFIYQNFAFGIGKTYRVEYNIVENSLSGGTFLALSSQSAFGSQILTTNLGVNTIYLKATNASSVKALRFFSSALSGSIAMTNVTVKEVGTDWTQGLGWTIGENKANSAQALGSQLILNPSFSQVGSELVTNGNFDAGVDKVLNGNFTNGTADWTPEASSTITVGTHFGKDDVAKINITAASTADRITQPFTFVNGGSYKVTVEVYVKSGSFRVDTSDTIFPNDFVSTTTLNSWQTLTGYFTTIAGGTNKIFVRGEVGNEISEFYVNTISIEELGEDWVEADTGVMSFNADGLKITAANFGGGDNRVYQSSVTEDNKSYKYTITIDSITSGCSVSIFDGSNYINPQSTTGTFYFTRKGTNDDFYLALFGVSSASDFVQISSVTVQEVGQNWTPSTSLDGDIQFTAQGLKISNGASNGQAKVTQPSIFENGKTYKFKYKIVEYIGGDIGLAGESLAMSRIPGDHVEYLTRSGDTTDFVLGKANDNTDVTVTNLSIEEISTSYLQQDGVLVANKSWKFNYTVSNYSAGTVSATDFGKVISANGPVVDFVNLGATSDFSIKNIDGYFVGSVTAVSAFRVDPNNRWSVGTGWVIGDDVAIKGVGVGTLSQGVSAIATEFYRVTFTVVSFTSDPSTTELNIDLGGASAQQVTSTGSKTLYFRAINTADLRFYGGDFRGSITSVVVEQLDPNNYWVVSTGDGAGIEFNKAVFTFASIGANFSQSTFTIVSGRTYRASIALLTTTTGFLELSTSKDLLIGDLINTSGVKSFDFVGDGSTGFNIQTASISVNNQQFTNVSIKQLGSYSDQSIYVTVKDRQTISSIRIVYLIELTSLGSLNSLYFIPSSVVASNGRFTKMNFTVVSTDATPQPTLGIISFYDSTGGRDTYPMGFYTYKIYEQTSSTNLDPTLATKQLQQGMAYVHDYLGNMKEVTPPFNEYTPTPIQYIYP